MKEEDKNNDGLPGVRGELEVKKEEEEEEKNKEEPGRDYPKPKRSER